MRRLLMLDDDVNVLHALQRTLRQCDFADELRIEIFTNAHEALARASVIDFDIVLSDYRMPSMNGITFLQKLRALQPEAIRLILSAATEAQILMRAINEAEIFRYIPKPWQFPELYEVISQAMTRCDEADRIAIQIGRLSAQEIAQRRLEADEPGITQVNWGPDGSVHLE